MPDSYSAQDTQALCQLNYTLSPNKAIYPEPEVGLNPDPNTCLPYNLDLDRGTLRCSLQEHIGTSFHGKEFATTTTTMTTTTATIRERGISEKTHGTEYEIHTFSIKDH